MSNRNRKSGRANASRRNIRAKIRRAERAAAARGTQLLELRTSPVSGRSVYEYADGARTVELDESTANVLGEYKAWANAEFVRRWGREMRGDDLLFPDWDADEPNVPMGAARMEADMVETMETVGIDPALIYAYQHTGQLVTEENWDLLSVEDQQAWNDAINRYQRLRA